MGGFLYLYVMIDNVLNRIKSITESKIYDWVDEFISINKEKILNMPKDRLKHGESVHGDDVVAYYKRPSYALMKEKMNPLAKGTVDLFLTGDFFKGFDIKLDGNNHRIYSTDLKYKMLGRRYSFSEFGLTEYENEELINELTIFIYQKIYSFILR